MSQHAYKVGSVVHKRQRQKQFSNLPSYLSNLLKSTQSQAQECMVLIISDILVNEIILYAESTLVFISTESSREKTKIKVTNN